MADRNGRVLVCRILESTPKSYLITDLQRDRLIDASDCQKGGSLKQGTNQKIDSFVSPIQTRSQNGPYPEIDCQKPPQIRYKDKIGSVIRLFVRAAEMH